MQRGLMGARLRPQRNLADVQDAPTSLANLGGATSGSVTAAIATASADATTKANAAQAAAIAAAASDATTKANAAQAAAIAAAASDATTKANAAQAAAEATASADATTKANAAQAAAIAAAASDATTKANAAQAAAEATASADATTKANAAQAAAIAAAASDATTKANAAQAAAIAASMQRANNGSDIASATTFRSNISLGNVDNTSDANKPVSTATQTALNLKASLAGAETFTGRKTFSYEATTIFNRAANSNFLFEFQEAGTPRGYMGADSNYAMLWYNPGLTKSLSWNTTSGILTADGLNVGADPVMTRGATETVTGDKTFSGQIYISNASPFIHMKETDAASGSQGWSQYASGGIFYHTLDNDANSPTTVIYNISRSGTASCTFDFASTTTLTKGGNTIYHAGNVGTAGATLIGYTPANKSGETFTGQVIVPDGSAAAPGIRFTSAQTGMHRDTNGLYLDVAGVACLQIGADKSIIHSGVSNTVIDPIGILILREYTEATKPAATTAGRLIAVTDGATGWGIQRADGSAWQGAAA